MNDSERINVLNRSASSPDILMSPSSVHRRIYVEEVIKHPAFDHSLIRHYSSEEVFAGRIRNANLQIENTTFYNHSTPLKIQNNITNTSSIGNFVLKPISRGLLSNFGDSFQNQPISCGETPMDVDSFDKSNDKNNVEVIENKSNENLIEDTNEAKEMETTEQDKRRKINAYFARKRRLRKLNKTTDVSPIEVGSDLIHIGSKKNSLLSISCCTKFLLVVFCAIIGVVIYIQEPFLYVDKNIQLERIRHDLHENVLSQNDPIMMVIRSLEVVEKWPKKTKVLPFVGSSGVGKTYIANIIKKHFHPYVIHELNQLQLQNKMTQGNVISALNSCCCNLLIIDDLKASDLDDVIQLLESVPKNQYLLAIPIFSVQYTNDQLEHHINYNDYRKIELAFDKSALYHEVVLFSEISVDIVKSWLVKHLQDVKGIHSENHDKLVQSILVDHDVKYNGLKGLHSKIYTA